MDHVDTKLLPLTLIAQHVDAVRAMVAETAGEQENHTARALVDGLADVTEDFVARNGRPEQDD
jgi:hypothetical protein